MADELRGIDYLRSKLNAKASRVLTRYEYYEMQERSRSYSLTTPAWLRAYYSATIGWCTRAVDAVADRMVFRQFGGNDILNLNAVFAKNNPDILTDAAILSALIGSCSFLYISPDGMGNARLQVIDGANATGILDPITYMLREGYAVLDRDDRGNATLEAYFTPERTEFWNRINGTATVADVQENAAGYCLLVPVIYRPDAKRPFGHSRISRTCMYLQDFAKRTLERSEISAEFYSVPQRYALGVDPTDDGWSSWQATITTMLAIGKDPQDGSVPSVGSFQTQSMQPFIEQIRQAAAVFAGETGLTMDDLGFVQDNPSSSEAIKASHETLRMTVRKAQRTLGTGLMNGAFVARCVEDEMHYDRVMLSETYPVFEPIFEPDASMLSLIGDGAIKINQAVPGYFGRDNLRTLTGVEGSSEPVPEPVEGVDNGSV